MKILINHLNEASIAYYKYDKPIISDKEYDALYDQLVELEKESGIILAGSPTQKVQGYLLGGFKKVQHSKPMLSAAKTKDINEIKKFLGNNTWYCSGKLDGLTLVVVYDNGEFVQGITRGNGAVGEDVTEACRFIKNLPMKIPYKHRLELRGECVMSWDEFNRINENLTDKYSHPRNLAAGTLRQLDLNIVKNRELSFVVFECVTDINDSKLVELAWLNSIGFETVTRTKKNINSYSLDSVVDMSTNSVQHSKYPYDGLIFEIDSKTISKSLGKTAHHESCRMALKWKDEVYETILRDVEWNTGKTGVIFPTGVVDPVDLDGAITSKVTLHNISYIKNLQLGIGDRVTLYRSNMVIPAIDDNLTRSGEIEIPSTCPDCGAPTRIVKQNDSEVLMCTNDDCRGRVIGRWETFVSKKAMDIDGLSTATIERFYKLGYLTNLFGSIYELHNYKKELYKLDGFGKKSIDNLIASIEKSKNTDMQHLITSLSIPGIGENQAKLLSKYFNTIGEFLDAGLSSYRFDKIPGIGDILNANIHKWVVNNSFQIIDLMEYITIKQQETNQESQVLKGKTFVVTGTVNHFKNRDELKEKIESLGGKVAGSVSKNTSFLINNDVTSTSGKNKKAQELGVKIISEEDFMRLIE